MQKPIKIGLVAISILIVIWIIMVGISRLQEKSGLTSEIPAKTLPAPVSQPVTDHPASIPPTVGKPASDQKLPTLDDQKNNTSVCDKNTQCGTACLYNNEIYPTKELAGYCWMTKNINTAAMADGITSSNRYCYNDDASICDTDGGLYTWADAYGLPLNCNTAPCTVVKNQQGICPNGWHVVTEVEWTMLTKKYSYEQLIVGGSSGFGAMLVGYRNAYNNGIYDYRGLSGHYWSSTNFDKLQVWYRSFYSDSEERTIYRSKAVKTGGAAVRCVKN